MEADDGLVRLARNGDPAAFEELVRRTSRLLYARLYLETGDRHHAEDLVQDTYVRAWRSMKQVTDPSGFRKWLATIAQSVAIDSARRASRKKRAEPPRTSQDALEGHPDRPPERPEVEERRDKVRAILQSMPEEYRMALTLRYVEGADYETISTQLHLTNGSLRGLLHRGLKLLKGALKPEVRHESR